MQDISNIQKPLPGNIEALRGRNDPAALKAAAKEMESLFINEMLKVMRESSGTPSGGFGGDTYASMFDTELSKVLAERGFGLSESITKGLTAKTANTDLLPSLPPSAHGLKSDPANGLRTILPGISNPRISSGYGLRDDPFTGERKFHHGIDIPAPEGSDIHPVKDGTVVFSGEQNGYGNVVIIDHGDGFTSKYAHNQQNLVHEGERVVSSTVIALAGSTGRTTGPHVHFELAYKGENVNPGGLHS